MFTVSNDVPKEIKEIIVKMVDKKGNLSSAKVKYAPEWFTQWFKDHEDVMSPRALFNLIKNGLDYIPFCEYCHTTQLTPWQYQKGHYYCCNQHAQLDKKTQEKVAKAFEKYEGGHPLRDSSVRKKIMETNLERYGATVACNTKEWQEKIKQRNLETYGVKHKSQLKEFQEQRVETYRKNSIEKYGVPNPIMTEEIKTKANTNHKCALWEKMQLTAQRQNLKILSTLDDYLSNKPFKYKCVNCGTIFETQDAPFKATCEKCYYKHN